MLTERDQAQIYFAQRNERHRWPSDLEHDLPQLVDKLTAEILDVRQRKARLEAMLPAERDRQHDPGYRIASRIADDLKVLDHGVRSVDDGTWFADTEARRGQPGLLTLERWADRLVQLLSPAPSA